MFWGFRVWGLILGVSGLRGLGLQLSEVPAFETDYCEPVCQCGVMMFT